MLSHLEMLKKDVRQSHFRRKLEYQKAKVVDFTAIWLARGKFAFSPPSIEVDHRILELLLAPTSAKTEQKHFCSVFVWTAPAGFEPATHRLTVGCSTAELRGNCAKAFPYYRIDTASVNPQNVRVPDLPTISVVIPTLGEANRIEKLVTALRAQTVAPLEILVCDAHSDDDTARIAADAGATVLLCPRGTSKQRNIGARAARGELLVFLDADDLPSPRFLESVARSYRKFPFAVACPWFVARDSGPVVAAIYALFNVSFWLSQSTIRAGSGVCLICPRDKFIRCGGFHEEMHLGEDVRLIRQLCPRFGLHRHVLIPLETSGRRFVRDGIWKLLGFYLFISPFALLGWWALLQKLAYEPISDDHD